jgi:hypothetical protein
MRHAGRLGGSVAADEEVSMAHEVTLSQLIRHVRQQLHEAAAARREAGERAILRVETVTIELHTVATSSKEGKGGVDLKIVTVGGQKAYSEQETQKIVVVLRAKLPDEPEYDNDDLEEEE